MGGVKGSKFPINKQLTKVQQIVRHVYMADLQTLQYTVSKKF